MPELTEPKMDFADTSDLRKVVRDHFDKLSNEPPAVMPEGYSAPLSTKPLNVQIREAQDREIISVYRDDWEAGARNARAHIDHIEELRGLIQEIHQHYNPGAEPFDINAALVARRNT